VPKGADRCRWLQHARSDPYAAILALREAAGRRAELPW
jgi:hypothetical protein